MKFIKFFKAFLYCWFVEMVDNLVYMGQPEKIPKRSWLDYYEEG